MRALSAVTEEVSELFGIAGEWWGGKAFGRAKPANLVYHL